MYLSAISSRLTLYDTTSWDLKKTYACYDGILRDITWSDDSKYMLQVNSKGLVEILSSVEHDVRSLQHIPLRDTWSASFHREGHRNIAIGTKSGNVMIWDTKMKTITKTFPTSSQQISVNFLSFNSKNTSLAASMHNGDTIIYGLISNIPVSTVKLSCSKNISAMKFHNETRSLLGLATDEGHVVLRDINTNKDKVFFKNVHASPVSDFTYSQINKDVMISSSFDKLMHVYDVRLQNVVSTIQTSHILTSVSLNLENQVALGTKNGSVLIYDLRDYTNPFKVLTGHQEEVHKVSFQPMRKKSYSADVSLKEDLDMIYSISNSPVRNNTSDTVYQVDSPPRIRINTDSNEKGDDSFLAIMGFNVSSPMDNERNEPFEAKFNQFEQRCNQLDAVKHISRISNTPNNTIDNIQSNFHLNGTSDDGKNSTVNLSSTKPTNSKQVIFANMNNETLEELKDFIKLTMGETADDNRNYFLHIMMALTKQKLYLEKQLLKMNEQMQDLICNQNELIESNRQLTLDINQLKAERNYMKI